MTCLALVMTGSAQAAASSFTGASFVSAPGFSSIVLTTSTNCYMLYEGNTNGQTYGAYTKNKAGDKYYATGGGGGASSGIYYIQNTSTYVGDISFSNGFSPDSLFVTGTGWTAQ